MLQQTIEQVTLPEIVQNMLPNTAAGTIMGTCIIYVNQQCKGS